MINSTQLFSDHKVTLFTKDSKYRERNYIFQTAWLSYPYFQDKKKGICYIFTGVLHNRNHAIIKRNNSPCPDSI